MPIMEHRARLQIRGKAYIRLSQLLASLSPPAPISLSQDELQTLGIKCSEMALLVQGNHNANPLFCKLVPPDTMNEAFDSSFRDQYTIDWPGYDPRSSNRFYEAYAIGETLMQYTMSGQMIQEPLVASEWYGTGDSTRALTLHRNQYPDTQFQWGITDILRVDNTSQPHLACLHIDHAPADEGLRPSEVISAVKLMKQAIRLDKRSQFRLNPVYVYSLSSYKARILETYYEAGTFFVRKTPYIDFAEEDKENIKLYLRWMMSEPSGNTTFEDLDEVTAKTKDTDSSAIQSSEERTPA